MDKDDRVVKFVFLFSLTVKLPLSYANEEISCQAGRMLSGSSIVGAVCSCSCDVQGGVHVC